MSYGYPDWFYSALAQSSAATLAIIAAFMLTCIQDWRRSIINKRAHIIKNLHSVLEKFESFMEVQFHIMQISGRLKHETLSIERKISYFQFKGFFVELKSFVVFSVNLLM